MVKSKEDLYHATVRNDWWMPSLKSGVITVDYLTDVRAGSCFRLHCDQVRYRPCPFPPSRKEVFQMLLALMEEPEHIGFSLRKTPNIEWSLGCLSSLDPDHAIFQKGYSAQLPQFRLAAQRAPGISNADGFFDGLPMSQCKSKSSVVLFRNPPLEKWEALRLQILRNKCQRKQLKYQLAEQQP